MVSAVIDGTTYPERLWTFSGFWDANEATARQLAAIGHVYDRPPLEALEEGSRCVSCGAFVRAEHAIQAFEGDAGSYETEFKNLDLHRPSCIRLQIRIPLEPQTPFAGLYGGTRISEMRRRFEPKPSSRDKQEAGNERLQTSSFFSLPTELRLFVYSMVLPSMDKVTGIENVHRYDPRVVTKMGHAKTGPRDLTKANLLQTCRAVHNEALDTLYTNTTYQFDSTKVLYLFLRQIGRRGRELLKSIDVVCGMREDAIAFALLASCEKLGSITIRLPRAIILPPRSSLWLTDGVVCLLELRGLREVNFDRPDQPTVKLWMSSSLPDAEIIRKELRRPKGEVGGIRWIDKTLDV